MAKFKVLIEVEVAAKSAREAVRKVVRNGFGGASGLMTVEIPLLADVKTPGGGEVIDVHDAVRDMGVL